MILARIDRLDGGARQLIRAAAVIGRRFSVPLLQAVAGAEVEREDLVAD